MAETTETVKETRKRAKKGSGPMVVNYVDSTGNLHPRASKETVAINVADKVGGQFNLNLDAFADVAKALIGEALKGKLISGVMAKVKPDGTDGNGNNIVLDVAKDIAKRIHEGQLYARTGTAKGSSGIKGERGRPFDVELWVEAVKAGFAERGSPLTDEYVSALRAKIAGTPKQERKAMTDKFQSDPAIKMAMIRIKAERDKKALEAKKDGVGLDLEGFLHS